MDIKNTGATYWHQVALPDSDIPKKDIKLKKEGDKVFIRVSERESLAQFFSRVFGTEITDKRPNFVRYSSYYEAGIIYDIEEIAKRRGKNNRSGIYSNDELILITDCIKYLDKYIMVIVFKLDPHRRFKDYEDRWIINRFVIDIRFEKIISNDLKCRLSYFDDIYVFNTLFVFPSIIQ